MAEGYQETVRDLATVAEFQGDLNDLPCGTLMIRNDSGHPSSTNIPPSSALGFVVLSSYGQIGNYQYGIQLATCYLSNAVYIRQKWGTWSEWIQIH